MKYRDLNFHVRIPHPELKFERQCIDAWLPSRGNVLFTIVMIGILRRFFVDGVEIELCSTFLESLDFVAPDTQSVVQTAMAMDERDIHRSISISAIPYGLQSPVEGFPIAFPGGTEAYREMTRSFRQSQGGRLQDGEPIRIFRVTATGIVSYINVPSSAPMVLREWFAEAGQRIWIVRITYPSDTNALPTASTTD
jgi:hypothetical protein